MKTLILLLFIIISVINKEPNDSIIKPGESAGPFMINKTTHKEILKNLDQGILVKHVWYAPHCGMRYYYYTLSYPQKGIIFTFKKEEVKKSDILKSIGITEQFNGTLENGVTVGESTKADIIRFYGKPSNSTEVTVMNYENLGIDFYFKKASKELSDTLSSINIYSAQNY